MKKRERLARVIAELALQGRTSAEQFSETLDAPVTTIYSDMRTLRRAGIPIHGEPGSGGGFSLRPDHTNADLKLAPRNAIILLLAAGILLARIPTPSGATAMRVALQDVHEDLPKPLAELCAAMWTARFAPTNTPDVSLYADLPELLTNAIQAKLPLIVDMEDVGRSYITPEAVQWSAKGWSLIGRDLESGKKTELDLTQITAARLDK